ncbi:TIGR00725 family protein [Roseibium polysiphoniae]|uniref:TIGR00725 family protein n=1 Tax=Roseibium polysiphoniae TaxID=2571221 RepID=UPI003299F6FE
MPEDVPAAAAAITPLDGLLALKANGHMRQIPIGVIGPREATAEQLSMAEEIGARLGQLNLTMICGGKGGVMQAAAKGSLYAGGLTVGLLPDHDWHEANPFISLPIATGLSEGRNMIIAKSCEVLIAVGGSYGTMTEIAYGLHFSKPVIGLKGAPHVDGLLPVESADEAMETMAERLFARIRLSH